MSARSLRALVLEDCALTAERQRRVCAARLLRAEVDAAVARDVASELMADASREARAAGRAVRIALEDEQQAAVILADYCGLSVEEWIDATCDEQGVELAQRADPLPAPTEARS